MFPLHLQPKTNQPSNNESDIINATFAVINGLSIWRENERLCISKTVSGGRVHPKQHFIDLIS